MTDRTSDLDLILAHEHETVDGAEGGALTDPERLGLIVAAAYHNALAERDGAREMAEELGRRLALSLTHLAAVVDLVPDTTWAHDEDVTTAARTFLADQLDSTESPEQESTT